jgi:hypothetical protein
MCKLPPTNGRTDPRYPNAEALANRSIEHGALVNFFEWLEDERKKKHITLVFYKDNQHPYGVNPTELENLFMEYLGVDPKALEKERRAILAEHRRANADGTA